MFLFAINWSVTFDPPYPWNVSIWLIQAHAMRSSGCHTSALRIRLKLIRWTRGFGVATQDAPTDFDLSFLCRLGTRYNTCGSISYDCDKLWHYWLITHERNGSINNDKSPAWNWANNVDSISEPEPISSRSTIDFIIHIFIATPCPLRINNSYSWLCALNGYSIESFSFEC